MKSLVKLLAMLVLAFCSAAAFGQAETGQVAGVVTDASGAVVAGAPVTLTSVGTQQTRTSTANSTGQYTFTNLQPGTYEVTVQQPGFAPFKRRVDVTVGSRNTLNASLKPAGGSTTVEVTAEAGAEVNTTDQTLSQVVNQAQVTQLPTLTRNAYDLVGTAGNVAQFAVTDPNVTVRGANGYSINGQRPASTDILLDGGENVSLFDATVGQNVPLDSVQEFRVLTSDFTAEYGRASGGVVNVATKSGTNAFHGTAYEFNRISDLAANNYENNALGLQRGRFVRNQFGYSVGGPIWKNKIFFFNSTEWTRVRSNQAQQAMIPDPAFIAAAAPNTQAFFSSFGTVRPNLVVNQVIPNTDPAFAGSLGPLASALPAGTPIFDRVSFLVPSNAGGGDPQNAWSTVGRFDVNFTDKTSMYGRYAGESGDLFPGTVSFSPYVGYDTGQTTFNQNIMANLTHIFSPNIVSQSKAVYNRLTFNQPLGVAPVQPTLYIQENTALNFDGNNVGMPGYLPFSPGLAIPFGGPQNLYQFYQDLSWTKGKHQFRFGGDYIYTRDNRTFGAFETAVSSLASQGDLTTGLDNFLAGQLFSFQGAVNPQGKFPCVTDPATNTQIVTPACTLTLPVSQPQFNRNNRFRDWAYYLQDTWKVTPRFTLNLGVRQEYYGVQHNANPNLDSNFYFGPGAFPQNIQNGQVLTTPNSPIGGLWNPDYNNIAPRVGFAFDVFGNGKTSIRAGYGISYERNFGNVTFNVIQNPPAYAVVALVAGTDVPSIPLTNNNAGPLAGTGTKPLPRTSLRQIDQNIKTAYAQFYSAAFEQQMGRNNVLSLEYTGSRGVHLYTIENPNRPGSGVVYGGNDPAVNSTARLNPQYSNINTRGSNGDSYYNAANVKFTSSNFKDYGVTLTANYTWSHTIDNLSSTFSETSNNFNLGLLDPFNPGLDRGNSEFDVRHRAVISAVWDIPAYRNTTGWKRQVMGGWSLAPIYTVQTGVPFTVFDCTNAAQVCPRLMTNTSPNFGNPSNHPTEGPNLFDYVPIPTDQAGVYMNPLIGGASDIGSINCAVPGSAPPCLFPSNMLHRDAFRGPGHWNVDLGIYKNFKVTERVGLQFRGELYNVMNHANLFVLGSTADVSGCTVGGSCFVQAKRGGVDNSTDASTREHRNVQLGLKLTF